RGEVRRRQRHRDPPQCARLPRQPGHPMSAPLIVLVGPMGVGKSTVGRILAERLGTGFRDTDDDVVAAEGRSISDIFVEDGEPAFRALEKQAVRAAVAEHEGVLALGGGAVLDPGTRRLLSGLRVVYLSMDVDEAVKRTGLNAARPLLAVNPRKQWRELMEARRHLYEEVATAVVPTDGRTPDEVAQAVLHALELPAAAKTPDPRQEEAMPAPVTRIHVGGTAGTEPYDVLVGRQLLGELAGLIGTRA